MDKTGYEHYDKVELLVLKQSYESPVRPRCKEVEVELRLINKELSRREQNNG